MSNAKLRELLEVNDNTSPNALMRIAAEAITDLRSNVLSIREFKALAEYFDRKFDNPFDVLTHAVGVLGNQARLIEDADNTHAAICNENDKLEAQIKERDKLIADNERDAESDALKYGALVAQCEPLANLICGGESTDGIQDVTALVSIAVDHIKNQNEHVKSLRDELTEVIIATPERREWNGNEPLFVGAIVRGGHIVEAVSTNVHRQVCLRDPVDDSLQIYLPHEIKPVKDDADRVALEYLSTCARDVPRDMASHLRAMLDAGLITLPPNEA